MHSSTWTKGRRRSLLESIEGVRISSGHFSRRLPLLRNRRWASTAGCTPNVDLKSFTVTPPIKPWPQRLFPKRLISIITRQQNLDLAVQIFDYAGKYHPGFSHNYDTYLALIQRLSRARAFDRVESYLSHLQTQTDVKCGENVFVFVIRNYGLAGKPKLALQTFLRIPRFGVRASVRSLNTLLNALVQNKRFDLVHNIFRYSKPKLGIIPNVFTCNILIKALCLKNDVEGATKILDEMPSMGIIPNVVTYTTVLGGHAAGGDMEGAQKVFSEMLDRGWSPDAMTYTILMNGYCRLGRLVDAIKAMDDMEENGVEPNEVTYGVMIHAYCKEMKAGEARSLLDDMVDKKYVPSSGLCCEVIDALCKEGKVDNAYEMWKRLLSKNCMPDNVISSTLIHWLCKDGKLREAKKLFDEFEKGSIPSLLTYNTLIAGMCEKGELCEVGRLWDDMVEKGHVPNAFTFNMLIEGFCKVGNPMEGLRVLEEMVEKGCTPNQSTFCCLFENIFNYGKGGEAIRILSVAISSGGISTNSWDFLVSKCVSSNFDDADEILERILLGTISVIS